jgi:hypothetical protein
MAKKASDSKKSVSERYNAALEQKRFATSKVSDLCRIVGISLLALSYSVLISDAAVPKELVKNNSKILFLLGLSGALTIAFDYIQYFAAKIQSEQALKNNINEFQPNKNWKSTRIRNGAYICKQYTTLFGVVLLVIFSLVAFQQATQ